MYGFHRAVTMLVLAAASGCGGGDGPTDPDDGGDNGDGTARVTLTVEGQAGTERNMVVRYVIADGLTTRAAASAIRPTPFGCFSDVNPTCPINVPVGKTISFFAIEGEGVAGDDRSNGRPVPPPDPLRHEFVSYVGDCETGVTLGDCVLRVTADREYQVRAQFAQMRAVVFQMVGSGTMTYQFTARDRLAFPNQPYQNTGTECCGVGAVFVPAAPLVYAYLPTGSSVSATAHSIVSSLSSFIQWDRGCIGDGGLGGTCTLIVGPTPTPTATAKFEYFDCGNLGYSDGGNGPTPPPGCTRIRP